MSFKFAAVLVLAILLVVFAVQNYQVVELRFLVWKLEMSRAIMLFGVFGSGAIVGALASSLRRVSTRSRHDR